jgi:hypothetical protein
MSEPESIELDGVSYVPRLWLRGHRDALDTALVQLAALKAAARAAMPLLYTVDGDSPGRDWCADCGPVAPAPHTTHFDICRVVPLAALLDGAS